MGFERDGWRCGYDLKQGYGGSTRHLWGGTLSFFAIELEAKKR
jgi:hypothetical protein